LQITKQDGTKGLGHPALVLKYSCFKNMGTLLEKQGELREALQHYLQVMCFYNIYSCHTYLQTVIFILPSDV